MLIHVDPFLNNDWTHYRLSLYCLRRAEEAPTTDYSVWKASPGLGTYSLGQNMNKQTGKQNNNNGNDSNYCVPRSKNSAPRTCWATTEHPFPPNGLGHHPSFFTIEGLLLLYTGVVALIPFSNFGSFESFPIAKLRRK